MLPSSLTRFPRNKWVWKYKFVINGSPWESLTDYIMTPFNHAWITHHQNDTNLFYSEALLYTGNKGLLRRDWLINIMPWSWHAITIFIPAHPPNFFVPTREGSKALCVACTQLHGLKLLQMDKHKQYFITRELCLIGFCYNLFCFFANWTIFWVLCIKLHEHTAITLVEGKLIQVCMCCLCLIRVHRIEDVH